MASRAEFDLRAIVVWRPLLQTDLWLRKVVTKVESARETSHA